MAQMISLWRDPKGERVFNTTQRENTDTSRFNDKTKISLLEKEILSLKQQLSKSHPSENVRLYMYVCTITLPLFIIASSKLQTRNNDGSGCSSKIIIKLSFYNAVAYTTVCHSFKTHF